MTPVKVTVFPRDSNPYQEMLHAALRANDVQVGYLPMPTPSQSLNLLLMPVTLVRVRLAGARILHLHWVFTFKLPGTSTLPPLRLLAQLWFGVVLLSCRALGIRVVWTAHNVLPHEQVFWNDEAGRRMLLRASAHVIVHDKRVVDELRALLRYPDELPPISVIPHGSYKGWYPQALPQAEARRRLGLSPEATVLLFFGRVTEQKGIPALLSAFTALCAEQPLASTGTSNAPLLIVAGRCTDTALARQLAASAATLRDWMMLDLRYLPDDELAVYLAAADATVLPFRTATTSGSAILAMTFGRVAIVPDLPAFDDLPPGACIRYQQDDPDGLRAAMAAVCAMSRSELMTLGGRGRPAAGQDSWAEAGRLTASAYRMALAGDA